jgi:type II secretory pathway component PulJ
MKRLAILHPSAARYRPQARLGMTLIEVLIATALTLVIMLALAQGFKTLSQGVTAGRSRLTGSDQLRGMSSLLRADLAGMTANVRQMPNTQQAANGYFLYYDGPLSDSTAMLYNYLPTAATPEEKLSASRWSDIDDVLMFTAKAKDGQWFRGRVPLALLKIHQRNVTKNTNIQPTLQDWLTDVSVASEYAEIVWFMRPLNEVGGLNVDTSTTPPLLANTPVIDLAPGVDRTGDGVPDPDGMPDRVALCRRVLLIRPDLNITPDSNVALPNDLQLSCRPGPVDPNVVNSFRTHMRFPYQRCDLSVRSVFDADRPPGFLLRTNSLADLQNPENRFAHYVIPFAHPQLGACASLPVLSLTTEDDLSAPSTHFARMIANAYGRTFTGSLMTPIDHGFVPAQFFRTKIDSDSNGNIISVRPTLEEILASNIVGFDVRGYDGMATQIASAGVDGGWGVSGVDDDMANGTDDAGEAGWPGTDDLVASPSDPGYAVQIATNSVVPLNTGAFVDLCWGRRVMYQMNSFSTTVPSDTPPPNVFVFGAYGGYTNGPSDYKSNPRTAHFALWSTPLSGFDPLLAGVLFRELSSMNRSGRFNPNAFVYQPTFDTFTDAYESDGNRQDLGFSQNGLIRYSGSNPIPSTNADQGINGNDDNGNIAVDDELELETRPPIVYPMPAIQVKFRIQDVPAGTLQEISMVHDLMGN